MSPRKLFVLDTNVILHDSNCIESFEENDVAVPITVLEELDRFKRGNEELNAHARSFLRRIDAMTGDVMSNGGAPIGEGLGRIRIVLGGALDSRIREAFVSDNPDHRILNTALGLRERETEVKVVLVTKDVNLRMKAKSLGLTAQDYRTDKVESFDRLYAGRRIVDPADTDLIDALYSDPMGVAEEDVDLDPEPRVNEYFIFRNGSKSALGVFRASDRRIVRVPKVRAYGIQPRNAEQLFALNALLDDSIRLVTLAGTAGTGKTLLALAAALECRRNYRQILLARPVVPLSNRDLGFLPGDIAAKLDPYMQPLYDNLSVVRDQYGDREEAAQRINDMRESEKLVITPLAYIRGRSLPRIFFIVDEAQNLTPHEVKTIITRAGEGTKIVLTGDIHQIDQPYLDTLSNGLSTLIHRMVGQPLYAHVTLVKGERSELAQLASELL